MKSSYFFTFSFFLAGCLSSTRTETVDTAYSNSLGINDNSNFIDSVVQSRKIKGCFILYDLQHDASLIYNIERANKVFLLASTFKIPNSLIALECEVIKDENEVLGWDSIKRFVTAWNMDQNMKTAFRYSAVWYYQELARKIGENSEEDVIQRAAIVKVILDRIFNIDLDV